jgi:hypothetical protein
VSTPCDNTRHTRRPHVGNASLAAPLASLYELLGRGTGSCCCPRTHASYRESRATFVHASCACASCCWRYLKHASYASGETC